MGNKFLLTAIAAAVVLLAESAFAVEFKVVSPSELLALFVKKGFPSYPYEARRDRIQGDGIYRLYVDENGTVTSVGVMKSTGSQVLDLTAAGSFYQWRAKPGRRHEIDIPMVFKMWQ